MKKWLVLLAFISISAVAQNKYITRTGSVNFEASVPSFEEVAAKNNTVTAILNTENGEFASLVLVKGFRFKNALMEEHFNENYAESDLFPKAIFKGIIQGFSIEKLDKNLAYLINGSLEFHGKKKPLNHLKIEISRINDIISITGSFKVNASEFDIKIPKIVRNKIAEEVEVTFLFELHKK